MQTALHRTLQVRMLTCAIVLTFGWSVVSGQEQLQGQSSRADSKRSPNPLVRALQPTVDLPLDAAGEPMPVGMLQRFGSTRFIVPGWWRRLAFAGNDDWIWLKADDRVSVIHRESGRIVHHSQLRLEAAGVHSLTASPDGTCVAISTSEHVSDVSMPTTYRVVIVSALTTGQLQELIWQAVPGELNGLSFSNDGKMLLTATTRGDVRLWNAETGKLLRQRVIERMDLRDAALSPDGRTAVVGGWNGAFLWKHADGEEPIKLATRRGDSVAFAPNGRIVATIGRDGARLWNASNGELVAQLKASDGDVYGNADFGIAFTPDSRVLAVPVHKKNRIELWDVESKERLAELPVYLPRGLAISHDGRWLAASGDESFTTIFDLNTRQQVNQRGESHSHEVECVRFADAGSLVTCSVGGARVWNLKTGKQQYALPHANRVRGLAASPDGTSIVTSAFDDTVRVWDRATGHLHFVLKGHGRFGGSRDVQFRADGSQFVSWGDDAKLRCWRTKDGALAAEYSVNVPGYVYSADPDPSDAPSIRGVLAINATLLYVVYGDSLFEFDAQTGKPLRKMPIDAESALAVSPDGRMIATVESRHGEEREGSSTSVVLRERGTFKKVREWPVTDPRKSSTATSFSDPRSKSIVIDTQSNMIFSPDSKLLAWSRLDAHPGIDIVAVQQNDILATIPVESPVWCLEFSADGALLATGHVNSIACVWNPRHQAFAR